MVRQLYDAQRGICASCGKKMPPLGDLALLHLVPSIDHVDPRSKGGGNHMGNMILMHAKCNSVKGDRPANGCERIYHDLVLSVIGMHPADRKWQDAPVPNPAMADALQSILSFIPR
ncbi:HNH endonuclease signature motif containing protein [Novosphingobium sp.]|uniref:HNH endonuclease n=1 Tax=Novosphingobium sp. TaxID=1874826 RepID=UPI00286DE5E5|nr:HNH endonuclease signature motif containing protein [Novosphingobium sp.]